MSSLLDSLDDLEEVFGIDAPVEPSAPNGEESASGAAEADICMLLDELDGDVADVAAGVVPNGNLLDELDEIDVGHGGRGRGGRPRGRGQGQGDDPDAQNLNAKRDRLKIARMVKEKNALERKLAKAKAQAKKRD